MSVFRLVSLIYYDKNNCFIIFVASLAPVYLQTLMIVQKVLNLNLLRKIATIC